MTRDPITLADEAEERSAADALRAATTKDELVSLWWREADHFEGAARRRLQEVYADRLVQFSPLSRAG